MDRLVDIALWGQHPEIAKRVRADWECYLADYRAEHSWFQTLILMIRSTAAHIFWRISSEEMPSAVPTLMAMLSIAVCVCILPFVDPSASTSADFHMSVAAALLVFALARTPWKVEPSRLLSTSLLLGGTGGVHFVLAYGGLGPAIADNLMLGGHVLVAVGLISAGVSGLFTKTAFGRNRVYMMTFGFGLGLVICADLFYAINSERTELSALLFSLVLAHTGLFLQVPRLLDLAERSAPKADLACHPQAA